MKNNDDFAKDTSDLLEKKAKYKLQKESYKVVRGSIDNLKEKRKVRVHRRNIDEVRKINDEINDFKFSNQSNKSDSKHNESDFSQKYGSNTNYSNSSINNKITINNGKLEKLNIEKDHLLKKRQKQINKNKMLKTNFEDLGKNKSFKFSSSKEEKFSKSKNSKSSSKELDLENKFEFTNTRQKKLNQKKMQKNSIFNSPLTSKSVGERSIAQKVVISPTKLVTGTGASLKESFNRDIENSEMAGIQLANQIVSPLARKLRFETSSLLAKKVGFDRKAYNLSKTEKKIMKVDKKTFKVKKAQRRMIRKKAMAIAGTQASVLSKAKIAVSNTAGNVKARIIKRVRRIGRAIATTKSLSFIIPFALLILIPMLVVYPILAVTTSAFSMGSQNSIHNFSVSSLNPEVMEWEGKVLEELERYNLDDYKDLALVIIQLESGGRGLDIMQSSESIGLPPNSITDPDESIEVGIKHLKNCIDDMNRYGVDIQTLIQSYNYGKGFIPYVAKRGGKWTQKLADDFSDKEASKLGWSSYGDKNYVNKAMSYITITGDQVSLDVNFNLSGGILAFPVPSHTYINSHFGNRFHPIDKVNKFHTGIDIPAPRGTPVIAVADGKVIESGNKGGYGKTIMLDHGSGVITLYAHNSKLNFIAGQTVKGGDVIAEIGSTGKSTGNHLHFEVRHNGNYTNPVDWFN